MKEIINEVKASKEINFKDLIILSLYATYFTGYIIGYVKRKGKEVFKK